MKSTCTLAIVMAMGFTALPAQDARFNSKLGRCGRRDQMHREDTVPLEAVRALASLSMNAND